LTTVFLERRFANWAKSKGIDDEHLFETAVEAFAGEVEADLGGYLFKKRLARDGEGKSGGYRTILCFRKSGEERIVFLHGFAKTAKGNLSPTELRALKLIAKSLVGLRQDQIEALVVRGMLRDLKGASNGTKQ
jgi:hypothetical protein